jgi:DNA replicative helicase MCM subunit Mcm2 (Cdc46/Mcm family)
VSSQYDQHLTCADCGHDFVWTAKEQEFYREKGYQPPKRCKDCRQAKKERREDYDQRGGGNR